MRLAPVIPVLTIERVADAVPLARALVAGGLRVLEITLRTDAALDAATAIMAEVPDAVVGLGTLLTPADIAGAQRIGARFGVSPGLTEPLVAAAGETGLPFLPGVATASEAMRAMDLGHTYLKFFPAEPAGGIAALKALGAPLQDLRFCPTGGITVATAPDYLALPNVLCVGGSWLATKVEIAAGAWDAIADKAGRAAAFGN
jgi:2-dehydro-3-deoxyphosphogluconate aldolase/(4S)-4-hydroxy-2-oxoglutarate aldolase